MSDKPAAQPTPVTVACGCNYTVESREVVAEARYGILGYCTLMFGVTARPKRIDFQCIKCGKLIHQAHDSATILEHTN